MWAIFRSPVLPEDEGRYQFITTRATLQEAIAFVDEYCSMDDLCGDGFFKKSDFLIYKMEEPNTHVTLCDVCKKQVGV